MITASHITRGELRHYQNIALYRGALISALGTCVGSLTLLFTLWGKFDLFSALAWTFVVNLVYLGRYIDSMFFVRSKTAEEEPEVWKRRIQVGLVLGSLCWGSSIWFLFPVGFPAYQALLVISVCAIGGGALGTLASDRYAIVIFQTVLGAGAVSRLLVDGSDYAILLAFFSAVIFLLLAISGKKLSEGIVESLKLRLQSQKSNTTLMHASEKMARMGYWSWESETDYVEISVSLSRLLELDTVKLKPHRFFSLIDEADRYHVRQAINRQQVDETDEEVKLEFQLKSSSNQHTRYFRQISRRLQDTDGGSCVFGSVQEITDIKRAQQKIYRMAYCDSLTGLANRVGFYEKLEKTVFEAEATDSPFTVMYLDADDFKGVNDYYGHNYGDEYLVKLAQHLNWAVGSEHCIARLGGDEFCVIVTGSDAKEIDALAGRIFEFCQRPISVLGQPIQPKLSVGVASYPDHGSTVEELVSNADLAMYDAKRRKLGLSIFDLSMAEARTAQLKMEVDLRQALEDEAFEIWYQPKIMAADGSIVGVEALLRWQTVDGEFISPDLFIPVAEHAGLIKQIGSWVLRTACEQLRAWNVAGCDLQMAINISGDHFSSTEFVAEVQQVVESCEIQAKQLEIEITESLSRDPKAHSRICQLLRKSGVRIAIDDFGTGYSSLSVLGQLEVDTLKIDQSFIANLPNQEVSCLMVNKIMELALGLGYDVVAEGVENRQQLHFLTKIGCPSLQGFLFSAPKPADQITKMLLSEENRWRRDLFPVTQSPQASLEKETDESVL